MGHDWLWELEAQGIALRVRGMGSDLVIMPANRVQELSPASAAATLQRLVASQPQLAAEAMRMGAELRGERLTGPGAPSAGAERTRVGDQPSGEVQKALSTIEEALVRHDLVALQIRRPETITDAELQMLEELRRKRSVAAPPLPPPPPPPVWAFVDRKPWVS